MQSELKYNNKCQNKKLCCHFFCGTKVVKANWFGSPPIPETQNKMNVGCVEVDLGPNGQSQCPDPHLDHVIQCCADVNVDTRGIVGLVPLAVCQQHHRHDVR